ncbi:MAG: hypothetical protein QM773_09825 [Hyphomonadaceae bacterium]
MTGTNDSNGHGLWTAIGAIGGLLAGAAAVVTLFIAKPDIITIVVPTQTLREVVVKAEAREGVAVAPAVSPSAPPAATAPPPAPADASAAQVLGPGLSVALVSVADVKDKFVATVRFSNSTDSALGVALLGTSSSHAEFNITDVMGGSCQMIQGGEGWGTLNWRPASGAVGNDQGEYRQVPPQGSALHTLIFNKQRCNAPPAGENPVSISGSFMVLSGDERRMQAVSFENIPLRK